MIAESVDSAAINALAGRVSVHYVGRAEGDRIGQRDVEVVPQAWRPVLPC